MSFCHPITACSYIDGKSLDGFLSNNTNLSSNIKLYPESGVVSYSNLGSSHVAVKSSLDPNGHDSSVPMDSDDSHQLNAMFAHIEASFATDTLGTSPDSSLDPARFLNITNEECIDGQQNNNNNNKNESINSNYRSNSSTMFGCASLLDEGIDDELTDLPLGVGDLSMATRFPITGSSSSPSSALHSILSPTAINVQANVATDNASSGLALSNMCRTYSTLEKALPVADSPKQSSKNTSATRKVSFSGSSSSTTAATSQSASLISSPVATLSGRQTDKDYDDDNDQFFEDDYAKKREQDCNYDEDIDDEDRELSSLLLARHSSPSDSSSSFLEGWHITSPDHHDSSMEHYMSQEKAKSLDRIRHQAAQVFQVFREFNYLVNEQQDDMDLIDDTMINIKASTGDAVEELKKANRRKQQARKRNIFLMLITFVVVSLVLFVYCIL